LLADITPAARGCSDRRLRVSVLSAARRLAKPVDHDGHAHRDQHSPGPFERTPSIGGQSRNDLGGYMNDFYAREFWRFVTVQQEVAIASTAIDYPPV
jgi:hypothetical protein